MSPDGRRAIVGRNNLDKGENELWIVDLERGTAARSGSGVEEEENPVWSPDGERFLFNWDRDGPYDMVIRRLDGAKGDEVIRRSEFDKVTGDWSRDGRFILFDDNDPKNRGLGILTVGSPDAAVHVKGSERAFDFRLSPDGRWVLWSSTESGRREVYVQRLPDGSGRQQVSVEGGAGARFSPDGKEIFFVSPDAKLMAATFDAASATPRISIPAPLFAMFRAQLDDPAAWDVAPDGKRFLMTQPVSETDRSSLTVVLNWAAQLEHP
jgi:Tol biopolymer transport system component